MLQRSIASRLSMLYATIFGVTLLLVVVATSIALVAELSHFEFELMIGKEQQAQNIAEFYSDSGLSLRSAAPAIVEQLSNLGTRVAVFDAKGSYVAGDRTLRMTPLERAWVQQASQLGIQPNSAQPSASLLFGAPPLRPGLPAPAPQQDLLITTSGSMPLQFHVHAVAKDNDGLNFLPGPLFPGHLGHPPRGFTSVPGGFVAIEPSLWLLLGSLGPYWFIVIGVSAAAIVLSWFGGRVVATQALHPLVDVTESLRALASGDYAQRRFVMAGGDEIATLTGAYNDAAASVASAMEQRRTTEERMRLFAAEAGHELRTPLTVIGGYIDVLRRGAVEDIKVARQILGTMALEKEHMRSLIDRLMRLARLDAETQPRIEPIDVADLLRAQCQAARRLDEQRTIDYSVDGANEVLADRAELGEALWNVVENALKYAPDAPIHLQATRSNGHTKIAIRDEGPGMSEGERLHAFERFYRGDQRGEITGSGLGLAIAKRAVERAGGTIGIDSAPGQGTTVTITL
jgi:signal transduction histidine kinase